MCKFILAFLFLVSPALCHNSWDVLQQKLAVHHRVQVSQAQAFVADAQTIPFDAKYVGLPLRVLNGLPLEAFVGENHLLLTFLLRYEFILSVMAKGRRLGSERAHPGMHNLLLAMLDERYAMRDKVKMVAMRLYERVPNDDTLRYLDVLEVSADLQTTTYEVKDRRGSFDLFDAATNESFTVRSQAIDSAKQVLYYAFKTAVPSAETLSDAISRLSKRGGILQDFDRVVLGRGLEYIGIFQWVHFISNTFSVAKVKPDAPNRLALPTEADIVASAANAANLASLFVCSWELHLRRKRLIVGEFASHAECRHCQLLLRNISEQYTLYNFKRPFTPVKAAHKCQHYRPIHQALLESKQAHRLMRQLDFFVDAVVYSLQFKPGCYLKQSLLRAIRTQNQRILDFFFKLRCLASSINALYLEHSLIAYIKGKFEKAELFDLCNLCAFHLLPQPKFNVMHENDTQLRFPRNVAEAYSTNNSAFDCIVAQLTYLNELWRGIENEVVKFTAFDAFFQMLVGMKTNHKGLLPKQIVRLAFLLLLRQDLNLRLFLNSILQSTDKFVEVVIAFQRTVLTIETLFFEIYSSSIPGFLHSSACSELRRVAANEAILKITIVRIINELAVALKTDGDYPSTVRKLPLRRGELSVALEFLDSNGLFDISSF